VYYSCVAVILLVDPETEQREMWWRAVESVGHSSLQASSVAAGMEHLHAGGVDAVIVHYDEAIRLDLMFAQLDRLPDPPPVVLVSRRPDAPAMSARYGAAEFVATPCEPEDVMMAIDRVLGDVSKPMPLLDESPTRPTERWTIPG
jgi:DNA-binding NtrC family response regulator